MLSPEQIIEIQKSQIAALVSLGQKSFSNIEKAVELNMSTARNALDDGAQAIKSIFDVKDVQELMAVSSSISQPIAEKALGYGKEVYLLSSGIATDTVKVFEDRLAEGNKKLVEIFESASKNAPAGSESAVAMMKSAITAANSAYDSISKAAKQVVEMTESNVNTAANSAVKAAKATSASKKAA